jgi:hypothetical protein
MLAVYYGYFLSYHDVRYHVTSNNSWLLRMIPALLITANARRGLPSLPCKYKNQRDALDILMIY